MRSLPEAAPQLFVRREGDEGVRQRCAVVGIDYEPVDAVSHEVGGRTGVR